MMKETAVTRLSLYRDKLAMLYRMAGRDKLSIVLFDRNDEAMP